MCKSDTILCKILTSKILSYKSGEPHPGYINDEKDLFALLVMWVLYQENILIDKHNSVTKSDKASYKQCLVNHYQTSKPKFYKYIILSPSIIEPQSLYYNAIEDVVLTVVRIFLDRRDFSKYFVCECEQLRDKSYDLYNSIPNEYYYEIISSLNEHYYEIISILLNDSDRFISNASLDLSSFFFCDRLKSLSEVLKNSVLIEDVNLDSNNIYNIQIEKLSQEPLNIIRLSVRSNNIGNVSLHTFPFLIHLDLSGNPINTKCVKDLSRALWYNQTLLSLIINNNAINLPVLSFEQIFQMLENNNTLLNLELCSNGICDESANHLAKALYSNNTLRVLRIYNNNIYDEGANALNKALEGNMTLTTLDISERDWISGEYSFNPDLYKKICEKIRYNNVLANRVRWTPYLHLNFGNDVYFKRKVLPIHSIILTCLLANMEYQVILPTRVWLYIFSFIQQGNLLMD